MWQKVTLVYEPGHSISYNCMCAQLRFGLDYAFAQADQSSLSAF